MRIPLLPGAVIAGTLVDPAGKPIGGASVEAWNEGGGRREQVDTSREGRFRFRALSPGTYLLRASAPGAYTFTVADTRVVAPNETVRLQAAPRGWIRFQPRLAAGGRAPGHCRGRYVYGARTRTRAAHLSYTSSGAPVYVMQVPIGTRTYHLHPVGFAPLEVDVSVPPGDRAVEVDLVFETGRLLQGRATDAEGRPLGDVVVHLYDVPGSAVSSHPNGWFFVRHLAPGPLEMRFVANGYCDGYRRHVVGRDPEPLEVVMHRGAVLRGRVVDARGNGVRDADVEIRSVADPEEPTRKQWERTDALGAFRMRARPGRYAVGIRDGEDVFVQVSEVTLEEGGSTKLELRAPGR